MFETKVAYLTGEFPRPTDTFIQREILGLRRSGAEVKTFAVRRPNHDVLTEQQADFIDETSYLVGELSSISGVGVVVKTLVLHPVRSLRALRLALSSRRPGFRGFVLQLAYLLEAFVLGDRLKAGSFSHLHNHFGDSSCTVAMLAAKLADVDYSFTLHGPGIFFEPHTWRLDKKIENAKFVVCISKFCKSQAKIFSSPEHHDKLEIVHCGVESKYVDAPSDHQMERKNVLFVGRLEELKGIIDLLDAFVSVVAVHPDAQLKVVGDGPAMSRAVFLVNENNLVSNVEFVGFASPVEVARRLSETDVYVQPSYAEGVPVSLMEAMAAGVPVVATQVGGVTELVDHRSSGLIIPPGDVEALGDSIVELLRDPEVRTTMGKAGAKKVSDEFSSIAEARKLLKLFNRF